MRNGRVVDERGLEDDDGGVGSGRLVEKHSSEADAELAPRRRGLDRTDRRLEGGDEPVANLRVLEGGLDMEQGLPRRGVREGLLVQVPCDACHMRADTNPDG